MFYDSGMAQTLRRLTQKETADYTEQGFICGQKFSIYIDRPKNPCENQLAWLYEDGAGSRFSNWEIWCHEHAPKEVPRGY